MTYLSGCEYHNLHLMNLQKVHTSCFTAAAGTRLTCILKVKLYNTCFTTNRTSLQLMLLVKGPECWTNARDNGFEPIPCEYESQYLHLSESKKPVKM